MHFLTRVARPLAVGLLALTPAAVEVDAADDIAASRRTALVRAVERVQASVVSVQAIHRESVVYRYRYHDPFFDLFFPMSPLYRRERDRVSGGSGLIVSEAGHILTNDHVIGDARRKPRLEVTLADGRTLPARYVASDHYIDLAVLQVQDDDLPVAPLAESGDILVGEWAIAIGNPFGLGPSVSAGVVSAIDRDFSEPEGTYFYRDMIQTDASINPGNSGGPLANAQGEVIGINSFIYTGGEQSIGSIGIGFAIPIDTGKRFLDEVRTHGRVRRGWTGIAGILDITQRAADHLGLPDTDGAIVAQVVVDSPAYLAGVDRGDVIVGINGEDTRNAQDVKGVLQGLRVGETCALELYRDGERQTISFSLEERRQRWY